MNTNTKLHDYVCEFLCLHAEPLLGTIWKRVRKPQMEEEKKQKTEEDRWSSLPPITVSGLISSNQIAQLNVSKADSP